MMMEIIKWDPPRCDRHCLLKGLCPGQPPREMIPDLLGEAYAVRCGDAKVADAILDDDLNDNTA